MQLRMLNRRARAAFTLLELLAVVAISLILMVAVVPALNSVSKSTELGIAAQTLADEIRFCRSLAAGRNCPVEICFTHADNTDGDWFEQFRSRSLKQDGTYRWVSQIRELPDAIAISSSDGLSNVLGVQTATSTTPVAVRFLPSGEMELVDPAAVLPDEARFITLGYKTDFQRAPGTLPANFAMITINPRNSQTILHRP